MQNKILVLGASGNVGSSVVDYLLQAGQPVAAAVRTIP
ncbi:MAG: NmrA family NAD(P)-binding protein, partial [Spirochaetes bacterium]|nr:NmrA family NAD(P)-binding protein [Spirochaetota bacterium]MBU0956289.1 NmrA family NAD(P)-binding protein [Spirochaetota bacterium]